MLKGSRIRVRVSNPGGQPPPPPPRPEGYEPEAESDDAGGSDDVKREPKLAPVTVEALFGNSASVLCTSLPQEERGRRVRTCMFVCAGPCFFVFIPPVKPSIDVRATNVTLHGLVCGRRWTSRARTGT